MDVVVWLRSLGLGKYEAAFRDHEIDKTVLPSLTHENLKELGVTALGHRLKLLDAIAALRTDAGNKALTDVATTTGAQSTPEDRAERRQVTVMFCDLVGSTALSARMDPEDLREVISAYQKCVAETVQRFGGFVAKYMGDGVNRQTTTLRAGGPIGRNASQRGNLRAWSVFSSACARQACLFDPYCHPRPRRAFNVVDCSFECDANAPPERRSRSASPRVLSPRVQTALVRRNAATRFRSNRRRQHMRGFS
jgi:class 3 adenylate cyclase